MPNTSVVLTLIDVQYRTETFALCPGHRRHLGTKDTWTNECAVQSASEMHEMLGAVAGGFANADLGVLE